MHRPIQCYEMHVPCLLQFFMDSHVYGMENVHVRRVAFRMSNWQPPTTAVDDDVLTEHTAARVEQRWWRPHLLECVCAPAPLMHTYSTQPTVNAHVRRTHRLCPHVNLNVTCALRIFSIASP